MSSGRKKARQSRSLDLSSRLITVTCRRTGISVQGEIPLGHYSRKQMRAETERMAQALLPVLHRAISQTERLTRQHNPR